MQKRHRTDLQNRKSAANVNVRRLGGLPRTKRDVRWEVLSVRCRTWQDDGDDETNPAMTILIMMTIATAMTATTMATGKDDGDFRCLDWRRFHGNKEKANAATAVANAATADADDDGNDDGKGDDETMKMTNGNDDGDDEQQ